MKEAVVSSVDWIAGWKAWLEDFQGSSLALLSAVMSIFRISFIPLCSSSVLSSMVVADSVKLISNLVLWVKLISWADPLRVFLPFPLASEALREFFMRTALRAGAVAKNEVLFPLFDIAVSL